MYYTWHKNYDFSDFTLSEKLKWNKRTFIFKIKNLFRFKLGWFLEKKERQIKDIYYKLEYKSRCFIFPFIVKLIVLKLKLRRKEGVKIEKSPYSESTYISYMYLKYDAFGKNYVKIRVSMHYNKNATADVFVYV